MVRERLFEPEPVLTERQYQSQIERLLDREGWKRQHVYRMKDPHGRWRTSTTAVGWPDLVALRGEWILAIEVKAIKGKTSPAQIEWLTAFAQIPTARAWVLDPRDSRQQIANWVAFPESSPRTHGWVPQSPEASALT